MGENMNIDRLPWNAIENALLWLNDRIGSEVFVEVDVFCPLRVPVVRTSGTLTHWSGGDAEDALSDPSAAGLYEVGDIRFDLTHMEPREVHALEHRLFMRVGQEVTITVADSEEEA